MSKIRVTGADGNTVALDAVDGWRVMEILRAHDMPIAAECGGAAACATCHIRVAPEWMNRLPAPRDDEEDKLDEVFDAGATSRLSCQIVFGPELDGLTLEIPASGDADVGKPSSRSASPVESRARKDAA